MREIADAIRDSTSHPTRVQQYMCNSSSAIASYTTPSTHIRTIVNWPGIRPICTTSRVVQIDQSGSVRCTIIRLSVCPCYHKNESYHQHHGPYPILSLENNFSAPRQPTH